MLSKIIQFVNPAKSRIKKYQKELMLFTAILLISLLSFAIGYIVAKYQEKEAIIFKNDQIPMTNDQ